MATLTQLVDAECKIRATMEEYARDLARRRQPGKAKLIGAAAQDENLVGRLAEILCQYAED